MSNKEIKCEWLSKFNIVEERLGIRAYSLRRLVSGFYITGNEYMGDELEELAIALDKIAKSVKEAKDEVFNEVYAMTQQGSMNLLNLALGVADKNKENK